MFLKIESHRKRFSLYLKQHTTIDFSDWMNLILFLLGIWAIFYFGRKINPGEKFSAIVLWFTAVAIVQYTKETYWLKQTNSSLLKINQKQLMNQEKPIIAIDTNDGAVSVFLSNVGLGIALNIETRISQIHHTGRFTHLGVLLQDDERSVFVLGAGEKREITPDGDIFDDYVVATKPEFQYGQKGLFAVIATYEDINRKPYYTVALFRVNSQDEFVLKSTKTGDYGSGNLESIFPHDWQR